MTIRQTDRQTAFQLYIVEVDSRYIVDADITEISACQKMWTDRQTDRQTAFQLYIID